jgi:DNA replicative helicase MCM subunit Mcm2 (Cdc46/Mcm family)
MPQNDFQDQTIECQDCHGEFVWTARDQEFYQANNFTPPKRCRECRQKNKERKAAKGIKSDRQPIPRGR